MGQKVLVIDLDPQANATSGLGVPKVEQTSMYRALLGQGSIENVVQATSSKNVSIVPSELDLAGSEVDIARMDDYPAPLFHGARSARDRRDLPLHPHRLPAVTRHSDDERAGRRRLHDHPHAVRILRPRGLSVNQTA